MGLSSDREAERSSAMIGIVDTSLIDRCIRSTWTGCENKGSTSNFRIVTHTTQIVRDRTHELIIFRHSGIWRAPSRAIAQKRAVNLRYSRAHHDDGRAEAGGVTCVTF